jgi:hypothetical protein
LLLTDSSESPLDDDVWAGLAASRAQHDDSLDERAIDLALEQALEDDLLDLMV